MFALPNEPHSLSCKCCTGGERTLMLLPVYSALMEVDPEIGLRAMRDDGSDTTEQTDGETPTPDDPFYRDELALAALLGALWIALIDKSKSSLMAALTGSYDAHRVADALAKMSSDMGGVVDSTTAITKVQPIVDGLIIKGAGMSRGGSATGAGILNHVGMPTVGRGTILEDSPSAKQVMDGIVDAVQYYTNNHFNTQVVPAIQRDIARMLADSLHTPDLTPIREALDARLASVPYWRLVANAAASRGFHYGMMKAGQLTQVSAYRWDSIIDNRTSSICRALDGRVFNIADAVNLMERASAAGPQGAKSIMPWPTSAQAKQIPTMSNDQLRDMGFIVPPAHGNCRSSIELLYR